MMTAVRTDKSILSRWWWSVDRLTLTALLILVTVGIVMVSAASPAVAERLGYNPFHFVSRHLVFLAPALCLMFGASLMDKKMLWRAALVTLAGAAFLMVLALLFGTEVKGATRWVTFMGSSLQPSEFIKPAFAVISAWLIARHQHEEKFPGHQLAMALWVVLVCLLLLQPDFGMAVVLSSIWLVQVFLSGLPMLLIAGLAALGVAGLFGAYMFFPHVASRIDRFLDPAAGDNYQVQKSLDSFSQGGLFGTGPGEGQVKLTLPDAHADFIFSVAGEEFGMIAALILVLLFCFIIIRSVVRVFNSDDLFIVLAAAGLLAQFGLQSLVHMGSSLQLIPAKGMTLPFISYGGSSLLAMGLGMGMLLALTRKRTENRSRT